MDLRAYLQAVRKGWWLILICLVLGAAAGTFVAESSTPEYAAHVGFYVSTPAATGTTAYSTDQFAQAKATSYATLLSSTRLAGMVVDAAGLKASPRSIAAEVSGSAALDTVIVNATVTDASRHRALVIARAIGVQMPRLANSLDNASLDSRNVSLHVVNSPSVSSGPVSPRKSLDLALGILAGLVLGLVAAVSKQLLDTSVRTDVALEQVVGAPVLATVNFDPEAGEHPLLVGEAAHSPRSEATRRLRTNLQFVSAAQRLQVLMVTSSISGEGKSLTATNLALSASSAGSRVLLIEADLRRPKLCDYLGLERSVGLTTVLSGAVSFDEAVQHWGNTSVDVLASGPLPPNPSELLGSVATQQLLEKSRTRYDMIVIDTPPLVPVTDAAVLASSIDGALVVFRYGKTSRGQISTAIHALRTVNAPVVGTVVNMRPVRRAEKTSYDSYTRYGGAEIPEADAAAVVPISAGDEATTTRIRGAKADRKAAQFEEPTEPPLTNEQSPTKETADPNPSSQLSAAYDEPERTWSSSGYQVS